MGLFAAGRSSRRERAAKLGLIAKRLGAPPPDTDDNAVEGNLDGKELAYRLTYHGAGKQRRPWTEVLVKIPDVPFVLELREQSSSEISLRERGLAVDVVTGDPAFDDAFIVEAAPADVARHLLGADVRALLVGLQPVKVVTLALEHQLRIEKTGHIVEKELADRLIDAAVALGNVREAIAAADAALDASSGAAGGPFRAETDATAARAARAARADELIHLHGAQQRRATFLKQTFFLVLGIVVFVLAAAVALQAASR